MKLRRTHIPEKLLSNRNKRISEQNLLQQVNYIFARESIKDELVIKELINYNDGDEIISNNFIIDELEGSQIFHISDIEQICTIYRLRFLDSALYKASFPYEAVIKIKELEKTHTIKLKGFKLMAPASLFRLENADDPLLFAPIGNDYYYLIHSWGKDLHPFRKLLMWPFRHLENFMFFLLILSFLFATMVPDSLFGKEKSTTEFIIIFFFMFKWVTGLAIFYGFKCGKNFSSAIWQSKYYNA